MFEKKELKAGEILCHAGDIAHEVYVVFKGGLYINLNNKIIERKPGSVVGEYGLFTKNRRTATLIAHDNTTILCLNYTRFKYFLLTFSDVMYKLFEYAINHTVKINKKI
jgi:CRP-like cAMP-binding protein